MTSPESTHQAAIQTKPRAFISSLVTNILLITSILFDLPVATYREERAGDDDAVGKWLERVLGPILFPSTPGFLLAWILSVSTAGIAIYRLRPGYHSRIIISFLVGGVVTKLLLHGIIESMRALPLSLVVGALYCQVRAVFESRSDQDPSAGLKKSGEQEPLLRSSGTMPPV